MKLVFMGTPEFAVPSLEALVKAGHEIVAVYTQPDRPKGRGQRESMPPVKEAALRLGLEVRQPERIRDPAVAEQIRAAAPEAIVVVGYGQILPQGILDIPPRGALNVHASLLPKYRGAAPIQWAVVNGETETGVTIMKMNAGLDTGDILFRVPAAVGPEETAAELSRRLSESGAEALTWTLSKLAFIQPMPQSDAEASHAPQVKREDGHVDWNWPATAIHNRVRGLVPWPGAHGFLGGRRLHIWRARVDQASLPPGRLRAEKGRLWAGCGRGSLELLEVQLEGKKRMNARAFLNGISLKGDETLE
jgi:methionyl-tRNA formyltransferase